MTLWLHDINTDPYLENITKETNNENVKIYTDVYNLVFGL